MRFILRQQPAAPDLVVGLPSVSDSRPAAGAAFTLSAEVRNGGDGDSASTYCWAVRWLAGLTGEFGRNHEGDSPSRRVEEAR